MFTYVGDASNQTAFLQAENMLTKLLNDCDDANNDDSDIPNKSDDYSSGYRLISVLNKADMVPLINEQKSTITPTDIPTNIILASDNNNIDTTNKKDDRTSMNFFSTHRISCKTGLGIVELESAISSAIRGLLDRDDDEGGGKASEGVLITRERHRQHLKQCVEHLNAFLSSQLLMDAAAEELRLAMRELGKVTGRVDVEELLDIIFRDFCIGK